IFTPTSPSRWTAGCTSSIRATSRYWTVPVTTGGPALVGVTLLVMTGRRLPIRIFAFSLLRVRMRGLASVLVRPATFMAFSVTLSGDTWTVWLFWWNRAYRDKAAEPPVLAVSDVGDSVAILG